MKIAFVYPGYFEDKESAWISHGLCALSACAKSEGHETCLIDLRNLTGWEEYETRLKELRPDLVGITVMTINYPPAMKAAEIAKRLYPQTFVVMGGIHVTVASEEIIASPHVDYIVLGEGELSFVELLKDLEAQRTPPRIIQGKRPDLDLLPFEDLALFGDHSESPILDMPQPFITVISSRGCLYKCTFCQPAERRLFGSHVRRRSVANVLAELKMLKEKKKFKSFMIHDDCLTEAGGWIKEFCQKYKESGFTEPWVCQVRADHVCRHPELIKNMKDAGLRGVHIGFESGSQRILDLIEKETTVEQNYEAHKILKELGIQMLGMFILGIPTETPKDVEATIRMIKKMKMKFTSVAFFTPFPGTSLYEQCKKDSLLAITDYRDYDRAKKTPKIKGVDYKYLEKRLLSTMPIERQVKNQIKRILGIFLGKESMEKSILFLKFFLKKKA